MLGNFTGGICRCLEVARPSNGYIARGLSACANCELFQGHGAWCLVCSETLAKAMAGFDAELEAIRQRAANSAGIDYFRT